MKKHLPLKHFTALALTATVIAAGSAVAWAAPAGTEPDASAAEVVSDEAPDIQGAADGSVSQVIGLNVSSWNVSDGIMNPYLQWYSLTTENVTLRNGKRIQIGYEIQRNGVSITAKDLETSADKRYSFYRYSHYTDFGNNMRSNETCTYRVRGLYYTETETAAGTTTYDVFAVGPWSETLTVTAPVRKAYPKVTGVKTEYRPEDSAFYITFNKSPDISSYELQFYRSEKPVTDIPWDDATKRGTASGYAKIDIYSNKPYLYFRIRPQYMQESYLWDSTTKENSWVYGSATRPVSPSGVEAVKGLRVEYSASGTFTLKWNKPTPDKASQNVYLYAIEGTKIPAYYNYKVLHAKSDGYDDLEDAIADADMLELEQKVQFETVDLSDYKKGVSCNEFHLIPGKTYTFIAVVENERNWNTVRTPIYTIAGKSFVHYDDLIESNHVTAKISLVEPDVLVSPSKTSVKLSISYVNSTPTGYEIWRKDKKWTRLTATAGNTYTDKKLKSGAKYTYRVRAIYYNPIKKVKTFGPYVTVVAETTQAKLFEVTASKTSTSAVKLSWQKVKGATRYEIYKSAVNIGDEEVKDSSFTPVSSVDALKGQHYSLIKSTKKNSLTVKKLKKGLSYKFYVIAYFKNNKKNEIAIGQANARMKLDIPTISKVSSTANSVTVKWLKDKFASKYELTYRVYSADGLAQTADDVIVTVSGTSYTISGIPTGGRARFSIRAISKSGQYSYEAPSRTVFTSIGVTSKIKAVKTSITANGKKRDAVKISWSAVSGAAYYRVYRSTSQQYNPDTKLYHGTGDNYAFISKEANDDESNDIQSYHEYHDIAGSVIGTSAVDATILPAGVTYYYTVVAYGPLGSGNTTDSLHTNYEYETSTDIASGKPAKYTVPSGIKITKKTVKKGKAMTWTAPVHAQKYYIYRSKKKNGTFTLAGTSKKASFKDKKAKKGTYYYKIVAENANIYGTDATSAVTKVKIK